ncbi:putative odorant receptor 85d [Schistocerca americana]|uniref:putative odorant receptor 85d n=1 Tax=Schistocerca americana TaxID=7009 RepID=UPI001F502AE6|nr:putative odorant receptor 85d [Schistocerca americana]
MLPSADDEKRLLGSVSVLLGRSMAWRDGSLRTQMTDCATTAVLLSTAAANFLITVCSALKFYLDPPEETEKASQAAFLLTVSIPNAVKGISLTRQRTRLQQVVAWLLVMRRAVQDGAGRRRLYARSANLVGNMWMIMGVLAGMIWAVDPLLSEPPPLNGTSPDPALPLPVWLPFDGNAPDTYSLTFALEAVVFAWVVFSAMCVDVLYITLIINVAAELHVLNDNVEITGNGADVVGHSNRKIGYFEVYRSEGNDTYRLLVKNIQHHQLIIKCVNEFQKATGTPVLFVVAINVLNLCSNIISLAALLEKDPRASTVVKSLVGCLGFVIETAIYCLPGQMIIDQSERLVHSAYSCHWPDADGRFKSSLLIFMVRAGQPLRLRVGKLITISRETYQELMKLSYQLFNLVYQLQSS